MIPNACRASACQTCLTMERVAPLSSRAPSTPLRRSELLDAARALAVIGVVAYHVIIGLRRADLVEPQSTIATVNRWLATVRMPALAFLIGLFIPHGLQRQGAGAYLRRRLLTMSWLFAVWYVLTALAGIIGASVANDPLTLSESVRFWEATGPLWFLPYLMVATTIIVALMTLLDARAVAVLTGVIALVLWGHSPPLIGLHGLALIGFTGAGAAVGLTRMARWATPRWWLLTVLLVPFGWSVAGVFDVVSASVDLSDTGLTAAEFTLGDRVASALISALGILVVLGAARWISLLSGLRHVAAWLGRRTLEIYVMHVVFTAAARMSLLSFGIDSVAAHLALGVAVGTAGPLGVAMLARRHGWHWLLAPPERWLGWRLPQPAEASK